MSQVAVGKKTIFVLRGCAVVAILGAIVVLVPSTMRAASSDWQDWYRWDIMLRTIVPIGYLGLLVGLVGLAYALVARQSLAPRIIGAAALSVLFAVLFIIAFTQLYEFGYQQALKDRAELSKEIRLSGPQAAMDNYETSPHAVTGLVMGVLGVIPGGVLLLWRCRRLAKAPLKAGPRR